MVGSILGLQWEMKGKKLWVFCQNYDVIIKGSRREPNADHTL